jgi:LemA protein
MIILAIVLLAIAALVAVLYNRLVRARNRVDGAWSDIDVQLQRRHDLIPQLVKSVSQYADYERATIEAMTALRAEAMQSSSVRKIGEAEAGLSDGVSRLIALAENYPDLKANENFLKLQAELVETEDYLQFARRYYNGSVRALNTRVESFPDNVIAGWFNFDIREYFQKSSDEVSAAPRISLDSTE